VLPPSPKFVELGLTVNSAPLPTKTVLLASTAQLDLPLLNPALRDSTVLDAQKGTLNVKMVLTVLKRVRLKSPALLVCTGQEELITSALRLVAELVAAVFTPLKPS
jgi:hypothetical protein